MVELWHAHPNVEEKRNEDDQVEKMVKLVDQVPEIVSERVGVSIFV